MVDDPGDLSASPFSPETPWPQIVRRVRAQTPARLLAGRAGAAYRTQTQLELRHAHAAARDAVRAELDLSQDFGTAFIERCNLFEVSTLATSKDEYLVRPDLGRSFTEKARSQLSERCPQASDLQIVIGDGLSVTAVVRQAPDLFTLLHQYATQRRWTVGQLFVIRHCRVGIMNQIGTLLAPQVVVLLIGERPGLATAESLSAYLAYRPRPGHTDANRNLISNIHSRGVSVADAAERIANLAASMMAAGASGYQLREELSVRPIDESSQLLP